LGDIERRGLQRYQGYLAAFAGTGLSSRAGLGECRAFRDRSGRSGQVDALIGRRNQIRGIVAASDLIALCAIRSLLRAGMSVPGDVSVVGFDGRAVCALQQAGLTTIRQDTAWRAIAGFKAPQQRRERE